MPVDWGHIPTGTETESPIVEKFDPTWPYNFKWGVDGQTGKAHVWRVSGGTDGRPVHRRELSALWGRDVKVGEGDSLGLACYIPAEVKLDGTVVAPPTILVQSYFGVEVPDAVFDWFHETFPGSVVRKARLASIVTGDFDFTPTPAQAPGAWKWIWSAKDGLLLWQADENDLPSHNQKAMAEWGRVTNDADNLGYATPMDDKVSIDSFRGAAPRAIAAVKDELTKFFPDAHIDSNLKWEQDAGMAHGDPAKLARRKEAATWAQHTLADLSETPLEAPESPVETTNEIPAPVGWLDRLLGRKKQAEADMSGAMVALFLSDEDGKKIAVKDGEPVEQMHITLCYFVDKAVDRDDWDEVAKIVEQIAAQTPPLKGKISGYGVFSNDVDVLWASPSVQGLAELRHKVFEACEDAGFHVSTDHDWAPHITLKYEHKGKLPKLDDEITLKFDELTFARGDDHESAKLKGHFEKEANDELDSWGAARFNCPRCGIGPYGWNQLLTHLEQVHGEKFGFAPGVPQDQPTTPPPPPAIVQQQAPAPTQPPAGVSLPTMNAPAPAPPPTIGKGGRPEPVKPGGPYDYAQRHNGCTSAVLTLSKAQVNAGHIAVWLGVVSTDGSAWIQAGIEQTYGETTPMLYVEIGSKGDTLKFSYAGSYQWGAPVHVSLHNRNHVWTITINGHTYGPVSLGQNAQAVAIVENWHAWPTNTIQAMVTPLKQSAWGAQEWDGWSGPKHFVTDGREVLTDPKDSQGLADKFRSLHPDAEQISTGVAVPTADDMGYGVWHGGGDVPIHDLVAVLDKELEKPTHLIDEWNAVYDQERYGISD